MKISMAFLRVFFAILSLFFMTTFMLSLPLGSPWQNGLIGLGIGALFIGVLFSLELLFKRYNLKAFNTVILGLFAGYLMGLALVTICNSILDMTHMRDVLQPQIVDLIKVSLFLMATYLGTVLTVQFSEEILISIPFVKLSTTKTLKKDLIVDASALSDPRILDLAATGLVDYLLIVPRFLVKELYSQGEIGDENAKNKAKRSIETLKKLEEIDHLGLRFDEMTPPKSDEPLHQLIRLARALDANILTADLSQLQIPPVEGIKIINLHALSNALKPLMQAGESMKIKIQRFGKEPNQGVGYLDDGTMVVVNGGGDYIGDAIDVQVLSVKHTSSGRMIFCNTQDDVPARGNRVEV